MNHKKNITRFLIIIFWMVIIGVAYTSINISSNAGAIGFYTWLLYGIALSAIIYLGIFLTQTYWNCK